MAGESQDSNERRLSTLEERFVSLKEGIDDLKTSVEKMTESIAFLIEKLDGRYPSRESVELRLNEIWKELENLKFERRNSKLSKPQWALVWVTVGAVFFSVVSLVISLHL